MTRNLRFSRTKNQLLEKKRERLYPGTILFSVNKIVGRMIQIGCHFQICTFVTCTNLENIENSFLFMLVVNAYNFDFIELFFLLYFLFFRLERFRLRFYGLTDLI